MIIPISPIGGGNAISNGGNKAGMWRTLSADEWEYLFLKRPNASRLFGLGSVGGVNGVILLPDNWSTPSGLSFTPSTNRGLSNMGTYYQNDNKDNFSHNTYSTVEWQRMESAGAVFLPAAGGRYGSTVFNVGAWGNYWSSSPYDADSARYLYFLSERLGPRHWVHRGYGLSVRLVR